MGGLDLQAVEDLNNLIAIFNKNFEWHLSLSDAQSLYYELIKTYKQEISQAPEKMRSALHNLGNALKFADEMLNF